MKLLIPRSEDIKECHERPKTRRMSSKGRSMCLKRRKLSLLLNVKRSLRRLAQGQRRQKRSYLAVHFIITRSKGNDQ